MLFPSFLHLPSIFGTIVGVVLVLGLWDFNPFLAVVVGLVCIILGFLLGIWWSNKFFESLKSNKEDHSDED